MIHQFSKYILAIVLFSNYLECVVQYPFIKYTKILSLRHTLFSIVLCLFTSIYSLNPLIPILTVRSVRLLSNLAREMAPWARNVSRVFSVPGRGLNSVCPFTAEEKDAAFIVRVQFELCADKHCQSIYALAEISITCSYIDVLKPCGVIEH